MYREVVGRLILATLSISFGLFAGAAKADELQMSNTYPKDAEYRLQTAIQSDDRIRSRIGG